jgi:enoyl-CoA hydratase/carnithine racemase
MSERVVVKIEDHVANVMLNRAAKRNAIDIDMFSALIETGESLAQDSSVRAVVLHGDGDHFCAGIDVSVFQTNSLVDDLANRMEPRNDYGANFLQSSATVWKGMPVPVIAALRGITFGGGFQIAMGADIRISAHDLQMSIMEIKWGLIPDMGISMTLPGVMPQDRVKLLAYTGRIMTAAEAFEAGAITALDDDPLATAISLAREIAGKSPDAIRAIKTLINSSWAANSASGLHLEVALQKAVMSGENQAEAARANMENRVPNFSDSE